MLILKQLPFQVFISVALFAFASSAPLDPLDQLLILLDKLELQQPLVQRELGWESFSNTWRDTGAGLGLNYVWPKEEDEVPAKEEEEEEGKVISKEVTVLEEGPWLPVGAAVPINHDSETIWEYLD